MMPAVYYREKRDLCRSLGLCLKCAKRDAEFPYSCCSDCRAKQAAMDRKRAKARRERKVGVAHG